ncbi:MAG: hypothetical protein AAF704_15485, partial [Cyanobacteria bacterium P01_D01_bin.123]
MPPHFKSNPLPPSTQFVQPQGWPAGGRQFGIDAGEIDAELTAGSKVAEARLREVEPQRGDRPTVGLAGIGAAIGVAAGATTLGMVAGQSEEDSERPEPDTSSVGAVPTPVPDILTVATSDAVDLA